MATGIQCNAMASRCGPLQVGYAGTPVARRALTHNCPFWVGFAIPGACRITAQPHRRIFSERRSSLLEPQLTELSIHLPSDRNTPIQ